MNFISSAVCLLLVGFCFQGVRTNLVQDVTAVQASPVWPNLNSNLETISLGRRKHPTNLTEIVVNAVTNLQTYMKNGNKKLGIPVLEPLVFNRTWYDISSSEQVIKLSGYIDGHIVGLTNFSIKSCRTSLAGLWASVTLEFSEVRAYGTYTANGLIADIVPLEGQGQYRVTLNNVTANLQPQCTGNSSNEMLKQFKVSYTVAHTQMTVDGVMGQLSDVMQEFLQDAEQTIVSRTMSWLEATLEQNAIDFSANTVFKSNMTAGQLIEFLMQF